MSERVSAEYGPQEQSSLPPPHAHRTAIAKSEPATMASREHPDVGQSQSYSSPNATQVNQGAVSYYTNQRQLTADELHLSAELSREVSATNMNESPANGMGQGQGLVLGSPNPTSGINRGDPADPQAQHPQHLVQFTPSQQTGVDPNHDLSYGDQSARRKRTKVSRACDECRRKKVRCDATSEAGVDMCSNCRRTGSTCEFSRVPMKRGPSKGYIKELADRINSLESQIQPSIGGQSDVHYPINEEGSPVARGYQEFPPTIDNNLLPRKRTYSMSEGATTVMGLPVNQGPRQISVGGWPTQPHGKDNHPEALTGIDGYPAQGGRVSQPFWAHAPSTTAMEPAVDATSIEIDEKVLDVYYNHVHIILPILPVSRDRLHAHLRQASRQIQEVFLHSLLAVTGASSFRDGNQFQEVQTFEKAQDLLYEWFRGDPSSRPLAANFILLHTITLMILEADQRGRQNFREQSGIPKATLVEGGVSLGYYIAKPLGQLDISNPDDGDLDSDGNLARRNWIVIGILSRWHMLSTAGPDFFGSHEIATPEDNTIVNLATMQLARYSTLLAELHELFSVSLNNSAYGSRAFKRVLTGQLNRLRDIERLDFANIDPSTVNALENISPLVYWSIHLLLKRHLYIYTPAELLYPSQVIIEIMNKQTEDSTSISSPFHFHFLALAVITLLELMDIPELANDAQVILEKAVALISLREKHAATAGEFEKIFATQNWENTIQLFIETRIGQYRQGRIGTHQGPGANQPLGATEQRSLQHLADLAVGAGKPGNAGSRPTSTGDVSTDKREATSNAAPCLEDPKEDFPAFIDFSELTKKGYLNVLAGIAL
ncbi:Glucose-responsive transcription factor [Ophidiomyces ophidiicola]|nr:Glucose-responsive transcription factor [Ophidiomyces ophidiicola]KAI1978357.1 Glucose-responsive transcription factor [Ophidiomyces ophidiicola]KAI1983823.1 Glucose-responsive transcription factor [Ophidiomyces ophidiicola]